jgi:hypothetical protein
MLALPILLAGCLDDDTDRRGYRGHSDGYRSGPVYSDRDWNRERDRTYDQQRGSRSNPNYNDRGRNPSVSDLQRACQQGNRNACVGLNSEIERRGGNSDSNTGRPPWENRNGGSLNQR